MGEDPIFFSFWRSSFKLEFNDCHCMLGQKEDEARWPICISVKQRRRRWGVWECRLISHSSFISLILVSGGVMFGTLKLGVLPKRCDATRNRCCFNLGPDLSKHEYITSSMSPTVFLQRYCILSAAFTTHRNTSCQVLHKETWTTAQ